MVSHRLFFHTVQTQSSYTDITTRRITHTSIARTTMLCPFALATCRGVWQSSFVTNAFAENSKEKKKHSLKLNYQRHKNKKKLHSSKHMKFPKRQQYTTVHLTSTWKKQLHGIFKTSFRRMMQGSSRITTCNSIIIILLIIINRIQHILKKLTRSLMHCSNN